MNEFSLGELLAACVGCLLLGFIGGVAKATKIYVDAIAEMIRRGYVESKRIRGSSQDECKGLNTRP